MMMMMMIMYTAYAYVNNIDLAQARSICLLDFIDNNSDDDNNN